MKHNDDDFFSPNGDDDDKSKNSYKNNESWNNIYNNKYSPNKNSGFNFGENKTSKIKPPVSAITVFLGVAATLLFISLLIVIFSKFNFGGISNNFKNPETNEGDPNGPSLNIVDKTGEEESSIFTKVFEKCSPSIVGIKSYIDGSSLFEQRVGWGSGIVMTKDGYVITNSHVVNDSKNTIVEIITKDGKEYADAKVVGFDVYTDVAVIKVNGVSDFIPADFGNSNETQVGERAIVIGSPEGEIFFNSITVGIISGKQRSLGARVKFFQTDASVNKGNSGGGLFNHKGQVIGINSRKVSGGGGNEALENMCFAIPISDVKSVIDALIKKGRVENRPALGISIRRIISPNEAKRYNVSPGVLIDKIDPSSSLISAGVQPGDIIVKINGKEIKDVENIWDVIDVLHPGDQATITVCRAKRNSAPTTFDATFTLMEEKKQEDKIEKKKKNDDNPFNDPLG